MEDPFDLTWIFFNKVNGAGAVRLIQRLWATAPRGIVESLKRPSFPGVSPAGHRIRLHLINVRNLSSTIALVAEQDGMRSLSGSGMWIGVHNLLQVTPLLIS
jgi:hypothetical protein